MELISEKDWQTYINAFREINDTASRKMVEYLEKYEQDETGTLVDLLDYAHGISTKYGEASSELACILYDQLAVAAGLEIEPAIPAAPATFDEVASAVRGTMPTGNVEIVAAAVGRLAKMAGADTMIENAKRDGAQLAWVPHGMTCAYCIALGASGWRYADAEGISRGNHAAHIHSNCDCMYAVRFSPLDGIGGYKPEEYAKMYYGTGESTAKGRINALRREIYAENSEEINEQKRSAYEKRQERESSAAEEMDIE